MIFIEQDAKRLLMERLDKCLKIHADMLDAQNIGSIYELQGFSELHYYLKRNMNLPRQRWRRFFPFRIR